MVFLPPDNTAQAPNTYGQTVNNTAIYPAEGKFQSITTNTQDQVQYPTHAADGSVCGGVGEPHYADPEYSYHYTRQSMILVQVNAGETFTIQAEDGTQCIQGPAQVPMVSPNGAIPPIHVPHGYISHVIEENGLRKVVVIPETSHFAGAPGGPPIVSQPTHGMPHHMSMQPGPHYNYMQQMNVMSLNHQTAMFPAGDHIPMFHQPIYGPPDGPSGTDIGTRIPAQHYQYQLQRQTGDMDQSPTSRAGKARERLQKKLRERQQYPPPDPNKNPSPTSASSISSSSSYAPTPSPNSSPDSSPRIIGSSIPNYPNGYPGLRKFQIHQMPQHLLNSPTGYGPQYPSPTHSPNFPPSNNGYMNSNTQQQASPKASTSDDMSSGSSSGGSPRRVPTASVSQEMMQQYQPNPHLRDAMFHSDTTQEPFPSKDGKCDLKEYLSAISKPEVYDIEPRSASIKWSMRYSLPEDADLHLRKQTTVFEIYLMHKGKDSNKFKLIKRECNTFFEIKDLKPGVEYHTKVLAELNSVKGSHSEVTIFRTTSCPPDTPGAPKMVHSTKNSIALKWMAPNDNGEKILKYHLEWDEGKKGSGFRNLHADNQRQFKVTKLQQSHDYTFRLSSENKAGSSPWSPEVTHRTSGTAPGVPDPPRLSKAFVRSLVLVWTRAPSGGNDASPGYNTRFTLEMDDGYGYGFRVVYDGGDLRAQIKSLNRSAMYKFRLRAYNNEGRSGYSAIATFYTLPDKPGPPGKVALKGKAQPTCFKVHWVPSEDNGGSEITKYVLECSHERGQQMEQLYSGPNAEYTISNVQPGQTCRLRVFCVSNGGTSACSEVTLITTPPVVPGQCAPPRAAFKAKPNIIALRWDPPNYNGGSAVTEYEVAMERSEDNAEVSLYQVYLGPALDHSVGGLKPGTAYKYTVRAANKVGRGQWSDTVELETSPGPPEKPDAPEPDTVTSDSVLLLWNKPHDSGSEVIGYSVEWGNGDGAMKLQQINSVLSYNFQHLLPDTTYFFRVQAQNVTGKGLFSDVTTVRTTPSCPDRIAKVWQGDILPIADYIEELGIEDDEVDENTFPRPATCAMVQWDTPTANGSEITCYMLEVTPMKSRSQSKKKSNLAEDQTIIYEIEGEDSCHLLQNLQPDSEYRIRVKAVNEIGSGAYSSPLIVETQPLPPNPPVLECTCSFNTLKMKWSDPDNTSDTYLLQMKEKHGRYVTIYSGSGRSYRVNRLVERTMYHFRINARNDAGEGPFSNVFNFTTTSAPPPQLKSLPSVTVTYDGADISWDDVDNIKGDAVSYILNIESCENAGRKQAIPLEQNSYKVGTLTPGSKHKVQVALVRHVVTETTPAPSKTQDVGTQSDEDGQSQYAASDTLRNEVDEEGADDLKPEDIIGQFSNWVTFEIPVADLHDRGSLSGPGGSVESHPSPQQTAVKFFQNVWARMSDETMAPVLLMVTFFVLAVLVAFFVQFMVE